MKLLKNEWLQLLILAVPFCAAALLWDKLPDRFPVHWNARGEVNGYAGKSFGIIMPAVLNLGLALLLAALPRLDPKMNRHDAETKISVGRIFKLMRLVLTGFLSAVILAICANALQHHFDMNRFILGAVGLLFLVLGNFMGKLRPNYIMGIRTPWTLESRTVWLKTHRLAGFLMVAGGVILLVMAFLMPGQSGILFGVLPVSLLVALIPSAYSYFIYRDEIKNTNSAP